MNFNDDRRRPLAVTGVLAVALLLAGTRWGSYLGYSPLFLTDILIVLAIVHRVTAYSVNRQVHLITPGTQVFPGWPVLAFVGYAAVRSVFTSHAFTLDWFRDLMPFLYVGLAFLSAYAYSRSSMRQREKTIRIIWGALILHLAWVLPVNRGLIDPDSLPSVPGSDISFFTVRPDIDSAILGITAALALHRLIIRQKRIVPALVLALSIYASLSFGSRAGLLAIGVALSVSYVCTLSATRKPDRKLVMQMMTPIAALAIAIGMSQTGAGERLLATVGIFDASSIAQQSALGTAEARDMSWDRVIEWTSEGAGRTLFGSGFGNNFVADSGAEAALSGTQYEGVRSPHNWFVGVYARLGTIGVFLAVTIVLALMLRVFRQRKSFGQCELGLFAAVTTLAMIPIATLGVVLESPFGAVPFWWSAGIVLAITGNSIGRHRLNQQQGIASPLQPVSEVSK